jgi:hypothetical protein
VQPTLEFPQTIVPLAQLQRKTNATHKPSLVAVLVALAPVLYSIQVSFLFFQLALSGF